MSDPQVAQVAPQQPRKRKSRLLLGTPKAARRTLARLIRVFDGNPAADVARFRAIVAAIKVLGDLFAQEREEADREDLDNRIIELEGKLAALGEKL